MARVLIADSSPDVAQLLAVALSRSGHEAEILDQSGRPALEPDVLVLDAERVDAAAIAAEQRGRRPELTVLATGIRTPAPGELPLGACRYLAKPFRLSELVEAVAAAPTGFLRGEPPRSYTADRSS